MVKIKELIFLNKYINIYFCLITFFLLFFNLESGIILGGDWTFPFTKESFDVWSLTSTWNSRSNFGESSILSLNSFYYKLLVKLLVNVGVPIQFIQKLFIILIFIIGQLSILYLMEHYFEIRELHQKIIINLIAIFYIFSPITYNYLQMGWIFMVIAYLLYPLFLLFLFKSLKKNPKINIFSAAIILTIALMQAQSFSWYFLLTIIFFVDPKIDKTKLFKNILLIILITLFLNLHWLFPLFFDDNILAQVIPKDLYNTSVTKSLDSSTLFFSNIFKFYGTVYNEHFEFWHNINFGIIANFLTLIPIILILLLIKDSKQEFTKRLLIYIFFLAIGLFLINLNKDYFFNIFEFLLPFRHLSRFIIIMPFLIYFLLAYLMLEKLKISAGKYKFNTIILIVFSLNLLNNFTWFNDLQFKKNQNYYKTSGKEFKLRSFEIKEDYHLFNTKVSRDKDKFTRSLYLPYGALIRFYDDTLFNSGSYSMVDMISTLSLVPGRISLGMGRYSDSKEFIQKNFVRKDHKFITKEIVEKLYTVDLFIYRKNINSNQINSLSEFSAIFQNNKNFQIYFESENLIVFEKIKKNKLVETINLSEKQIKKIFKKKVFYELYNYNYKDFTKKKIDFKRINESVIIVKKSINKNNSLVFHESYSKNWCLIKVDQNIRENFNFFVYFLSIKNFFINGCSEKHSDIFYYSNVWTNYKHDKNYILIFKPQIGYYLAIIIYFFSLLLIILYFFLIRKNEKI